MLQAMFNGVSAISATQTDMNVIGNNISNVDTTAFKSSEVSFADQLSQTVQGASAPTNGGGTTNPIQVGLGVKIGSISVQEAQGGLESTGAPTDMAIQGNGYFMTANPEGAINYQRDGHFAVDSSGQLVDASTGDAVLGYPANASGVIQSSSTITPASTLSVPVGSLTTAQATSSITYAGNLDAASSSSTSYTQSANVYDSLGNTEGVTLTFTPVASDPNSWTWTAAGSNLSSGTSLTTPSGPTVANPTAANINQGTVTFNTNGIETGSTGTLQLQSTNSTTPQNVSLNFGGATQLSQSSSLAPSTQDGYPTGTLQSFTVGSSGTITGVFSNGESLSLGQLALANFSNPAGLSSIGNNQYSETNVSGVAQVGTANSTGLGSISAGYLEQSNVDLATELTNMIVTERSFQANTKVVSTVDTMLNDLIQMKQ
jgi:flagellar hook protein FlgE